MRGVLACIEEAAMSNPDPETTVEPEDENPLEHIGEEVDDDLDEEED